MIGRIDIKNLKNIKNHEKKPKEGMHNYAPCFFFSTICNETIIATQLTTI
jgi:hypothetical protein